MQLTTLTLRQFRSYTKSSFSFSPEVTVVAGINAIGKTNILEAIRFLATGKSFRADRDSEVIRWGETLSNIKAQISNNEDSTQLELYLTTGEVNGQHAPLKKYLVNGIPRRQIDFVGNLRAVLFWPEDLALVTDSPSIRRRYLDSVLVQVDREYRRNLLSYERALRQRNRLLDMINEGKASRSQLLFWNQLLIKAGGYITDKRGEYLDYVNEYRVRGAEYRVEYDKSVISESRLEQYKDEEVAAKATLVGPHRDDFTIMKEISDKNISDKKDKDVSLSSFGSRGEQRLAILWLKLAELSFIEERSREAGSGSARPILLLDDIFSEFDAGHRKLVLDVIGKQQTIITTAEEDVVDLIQKSHHHGKIIRL